MTRNIKRLILQIVFLLSLSSVFAEHYDDLYFYAITLYNEGAYEESEVEFKRYLFMQNYAQGKYQSGAYCALAGLYEKKQNYSLAADCIQKAIVCMEQEGDSQSQIDALRQVHINYLEKAAQSSNEFLSDNLFIFSYMNLPDFSDTIKIKAYTAAISDAVTNGRFEYAQETYNKAIEFFPDAWSEQEQEIIQTGFDNFSKFKPKNLKLAGYLSFFPGLGQLYAHDYKDALNAFILNGSLIALSVWSIYSQDYWTFSLIEFNLLERFMKGNLYNAQKEAHQYNLKKQQEFSEPILEALKK